MRNARSWIPLACGLASLALIAVVLPHLEADEAPVSGPGVERARREVKMLDDLYKTAVVLVTTHYVDEKSDLPAGEAFQALFTAMKDKGWHEVRLLDASGEAINDRNIPQPGFEQAAVKRLLAGEGFVEQVEKVDGKQFYRAATPIPVVLDKCILCHENYRGRKGAIGALSYRLSLP